MPQTLIITQKYVIFIRFYFFASLNVIFFYRKIKYFEKYKICLLYSASTNLFSNTEIKIRVLIGLKEIIKIIQVW